MPHDIHGRHRPGITIDGFSPTVLVSTDDHTKLINRDAENQHPISAIEGLEARLTEIEESIPTEITIETVTGLPEKLDEIDDTTDDLDVKVENLMVKGEVITNSEINDILNG